MGNNESAKRRVRRALGTTLDLQAMYRADILDGAERALDGMTPDVAERVAFKHEADLALKRALVAAFEASRV